MVVDLVNKKVVREAVIDEGWFGLLWEIHEYKEDFIIYGEMQILRLDSGLNVKWSFGAPDVFALPDSNQKCFVMNENTITLLCWDGIRYTIDYDGNLLSEEPI